LGEHQCLRASVRDFFISFRKKYSVSSTALAILGSKHCVGNAARPTLREVGETCIEVLAATDDRVISRFSWAVVLPMYDVHNLLI
jgi:hypothetical protein